MTEDAARAADAMAAAARSVLGSRLLAVVAYGSSVTGDILVGYSDFDCLVLLRAPIRLADVLALQATLEGYDPGPFTYYQPTFMAAEEPRPHLVSGAYRVLWGPPPPGGFLHDRESLLAGSRRTLAELPSLLRQDAASWAGSLPAQYARRARLEVTRAKPVLRALITEAGGDPEATWRRPWHVLVQDLHLLDHGLATLVEDLLRETCGHDYRTVAVTALRILEAVATRELGIPRGSFGVAG